MNSGACYGWSVTSSLDFRFLRPGLGQRSLVIDEWEPGESPSAGGEKLVQWRERPDRRFHGSVHRLRSSALVVETSDAGWFRLDPAAGVVEIPRATPPVVREARLWTTPMLLLSTIEGLIPLHAACVEVGGQAVAISAPGRFGKTTLAAALASRGHGLLGEDITVIDDRGDATVGPDLLRLRPGSLEALELRPESEVVGRDDDRAYVKSGSQVSGPIPLAAIVFLKVSETASLTQRVDPRRLADLWQVSFHLPNLTDRHRAFDAITSIAANTPVFDLSRPLDWTSLEWTMDAVEGIVQ